MTAAELAEERRYWYEERLGILGVFDRAPTAAEHNIAVQEADEHIKALGQLVRGGKAFEDFKKFGESL